MQLVFVAHRRGAAFKVGDVRALVGDDERAFELAGVLGIDAEVGRQLHRAAHALWDVDERSVGKHGGVQRGIEVVGLRHHGEQVLLDQFRVFADGLGDRAEDDAGLGQLLLERGHHRNRVEHCVHGHLAGGVGLAFDVIQLARLALLAHAGEDFLLLQRNAQLGVGRQQFRIHLVQRLGAGLALGCCVVVDVVEVDLRIVDLGPGGLVHLQPATIGVEALLEHPLGLFLLGRNEADHVFRQALGGHVGLDHGLEAVLVLVDVDFPDAFDCFDIGHFASPSSLKLSFRPQLPGQCAARQCAASSR